jgi:cytolysin (calcineurin-like family phosphatase)
VSWPDELGGGAVGEPRGVVVLGDCIDDGDRIVNGQNISAEQYRYFSADFGVNGEGRVKWPAFEGWGNHDGPPVGAEKHGFSFQAQLKARNKARLEKGLITNLSDNGLHYSWDWDDVHLVQLNLYPADKQRAGVRYSPIWHNPQGALTFLKKDLLEKVGDTGRPVVLMSHCGFDTDWWTPDDWRELYDAVRKYNIVLYLYGHSGTGVRRWMPKDAPSESPKWLCINDGQLEKGFFVIQIKGDHLCAAMRFKTGYHVDKSTDGALKSSWDGTWTWRHLVDEKINVK